MLHFEYMIVIVPRYVHRDINHQFEWGFTAWCILIIQHLNVETHLYNDFILITTSKCWNTSIHHDAKCWNKSIHHDCILITTYKCWNKSIHQNVFSIPYRVFVSHPDWTSTNFIGLYWFVSVEVDGSLPPPEPPGKSTCLLVSLVWGPCTYALAAAGAVPLRCCAHVSDLEVARRDPQNPLNSNGCVYQ